MRGLSPKTWLVFALGVVGCAAPGLSDPMAALPYPAVGMNTPSLRQTGLSDICQTPDWSGTSAQPIRTAAFSGAASGATAAPEMQTAVATGTVVIDDPCASTRYATRPVRRFLRSMFCPEEPRLAPVARVAGGAPMPRNTAASVAPAFVPTPAAEVVSDAPALSEEAMVSAAPRVRFGMPSVPRADDEVGLSSFADVAPSTTRSLPTAKDVPTLPPEVKPTDASADALPPGPPLHLVNERSIRLNCKLRDVGPSGLSAVEVWFTQDGRHWQKAEHNCPPQPPYVMDVKDDGRYGITLIARNGLGVAKPGPVLGEPPQVWVEVDTTRPTLTVGKPRFAGTEGARELAITWSANDKNLGSRAIKLTYAEKPEGPWQPIADVENTGTFAWHLPAKLPTSFFVRVQATDTAGNTTAAVSAEAVVLDLSQPTVEILSVESYRKR
jgi:hypothetical protein